MSEGRGKKFLILKYFLMSSNAFGSMIGIFLVLFGISYPREKFPGGYRGQETAAIAGGFIFFSLIGYCGVSFSFSVEIFLLPHHLHKYTKMWDRFKNFSVKIFYSLLKMLPDWKLYFFFSFLCFFPWCLESKSTFERCIIYYRIFTQEALFVSKFAWGGSLSWQWFYSFPQEWEQGLYKNVLSSQAWVNWKEASIDSWEATWVERIHFFASFPTDASLFCFNANALHKSLWTFKWQFEWTLYKCPYTSFPLTWLLVRVRRKKERKMLHISYCEHGGMEIASTFTLSEEMRVARMKMRPFSLLSSTYPSWSYLGKALLLSFNLWQGLYLQFHH